MVTSDWIDADLVALAQVLGDPTAKLRDAGAVGVMGFAAIEGGGRCLDNRRGQGRRGSDWSARIGQPGYALR